MSTTQLTLSDNELIDKYYVGEEEKETETVAPIMSNNELIDKYYVGEEEEETETVAPIIQETEQETVPVTQSDSSLIDKYYVGEEEEVVTEEEVEEGKISKAEYASNSEVMDKIRRFDKSYYGKDGGQQEGETNEEYFERFLTFKRAIENNTINMSGMIDWIRKASPEERENFVDVYIDVENNLPNFYEKGGGSAGSAIFDYLFYTVVDPIVLLGGVFGKMFSRGAMLAVKETLKKKGRDAALKEAKKIGMKRGVKIGAVTEGVASGSLDIGTQRIEQANVNIEDVDIDLERTGIATGVGAIAGGLGFGLQQKQEFAGLAGRMDKRNTAKIELADKIKADKLQKHQSDLAVKEAGEEIPDEIFDPVDAKEYLEILGNVDNIDLVESKVRTDILERINKVALTIFDDYNARGMTPPGIEPTMKANEVVRSIIRSTEAQELDPDLLDKAISKAGLTPELFESIVGVTYSDAGKSLATLAPMGQRLKKLRELHPQFVKKLDELAGVQASSTNVFGYIWDGIRRLDREGRALAVTRFSTTAGNIATLALTQTMQVGFNAIESTLYHFGKATRSIMEGTSSIEGTKQGMGDIVKDTFGALAYLDDPQLASEMTEYLLRSNPAMARVIDRSLGEVGDEGLSKFTRFANTLNMVQDVFARKAVFSATVDKHLRRIGQNFDVVQAEGRELPTSVLKNAQREALEATFAAMPRTTSQGGGRTEHIAHHFIKFVEQLPFMPVLGTGELPYARFMVNALSHQLQFSPVGGVNAAATFTNAMYRRFGKQMNDATTRADLAKARSQFSKAVVGTAGLYAAIQYRMENQDLEPHEMRGEANKPADVRRFWPLAPILTLADVFVKIKLDKFDEISWKKTKENVIGTRFRMGQYGGAVDDMMGIMYKGITDGIEAEELADKLGAYTGEMGSRFTTPAKIVTDVVAIFDEEQAVVRDATQVEGDTPEERFVDAAKKKLYNNMPFLAKTLPVREQTTREGERYIQSPVMRLFYGVSSVERRSNVEKELLKHGMEDYTLTPRTGDKRASAFVNKYLGPLVEKELGDLVESKYYNSLSKSQQKLMVQKELSGIRERSSELGRLEARYEKIDAGLSEPTAFSRGDWIKLSAQQRALADEAYQDKFGRSVVEQQREEPSVDHYSMATELAKVLAR